MIVNTGNKSIVLFDGDCNYCNSAVHFIIRHDKKDTFRFAILHSEIEKKLMKKFKMEDTPDSIVLIEKEKIYFRSTAVLRISKHLNGMYPICYVLLLVPSFIRDFLYDIFAKNRIKWFGKKNNCDHPSKEMKEKFISFPF